MSFFEASSLDILNQECALLAERWHWTHEQTRSLSTNQRRDYLKIVYDLYNKEKEQYDKMKHKK